MAKRDDDLTLIEKFLGGDQGSFKNLVDGYKDNIFNTIYYLLGSRVSKDRIESLTQEVFLEVYNNLQHLENRRAFTIWLYQLAVNMVKIELSRIRKARPNPEEEIEYLFRQKQQEFLKSPKYKSKEFRDLIFQAIDILPDDFRMTIVLRDIEQLSYEDISSIVDLSPEVLKSRAFVSKLNLRKMLK